MGANALITFFRDPSMYLKHDRLMRGPIQIADIGAGANSRGSRLGLSSQGSGAFAVTPLQRLLSPSFLTPDNTFRLPTEHAQVHFLNVVNTLNIRAYPQLVKHRRPQRKIHRCGWLSLLEAPATELILRLWSVADGSRCKTRSDRLMTVQESACARLTALGRHVGSGLMAADMAAMLAQKRQESLARAEALAPRLSLPLKNLTAHRYKLRPHPSACQPAPFLT